MVDGLDCPLFSFTNALWRLRIRSTNTDPLDNDILGESFESLFTRLYYH